MHHVGQIGNLRTEAIVLPAVMAALGLVLFLAPGRASAEAPAKQFRAGAAASNITPWLGISIAGHMSDRKAAHIHDELYARCIVLDDGQKRLAIVVCDSCMIPRKVFDEAKRIVQEQAKLPADCMLMSATHTHEGPTADPVFQSDPDQEYLRYLAVKIADGVQRAVNNLAPAKIGWGVGQKPEHVFNRRWKMKTGTIGPDPFGKQTDQVRMNPPVASPDLIEPSGPTDPDVSVVSVISPDGRPIALLTNYSLHYIGDSGPGHISADYFGCFADRIQQLLNADRLDPPFVGILSNGTSGNINNINFRGGQQPQPTYGRMRLVANDVADEAYRVCRSIQYRDWVVLDNRQATIELGVRLPTEEDLRQAKEIMAKAKGATMQTLPEIYARETVLLSQYPPKVEIILQALRIGDLGIVSIPCEVFAEIGLEIKQKSPFKPTFTMQLANGYNGYLPTVEQHKLGGYETWRARSSYLEVDAAPKIVTTLMTLLKDLKPQ